LDKLERYRAKRSASGTPEPLSGATRAAPGAGLFVVQKHAATRLHYDLRLEMDGVLTSWAVPRGPSLDPDDKRLAVKVEEHPLDYGDFEGTIPEGNYGAGAVIVWDKGRWVPIVDEQHPGGLADGKLLFDLYGYKLRGRFTLVKTKRGGANEWLLIKKPDAYASKDPPPEPSIFSARTVEDVGAGTAPGDAVAAELAKLGCARRAVSPADPSKLLMLAEPRDAAPPASQKGWVYEIKYDGFRLLAARDAGRARLHYRRGSEVSAQYPELAAAVGAMPYDGMILDGELVVADASGRPSFALLQQRAQLSRPAEIARAAVRAPAQLMCFDLLAFAGFDLRGLPLTTRKSLLERLLPPAGPLRYVEHIPDRGAEMFAHAVALGLEGVIGKKADAPYRAGRRGEWIKVKKEHTADFVVVGFTRAEGSRKGFGALHLAYAAPGGKLVYAGDVGSGFADAELARIHARLAELARKTPPCENAPKLRGSTWLDPAVVAEVRYLEWTHEDLLRHPVFLRLRDDKPPADCTTGPPHLSPAPAAAAPLVDDAPGPTAASTRPPSPDPASLSLKNLDKLFWPDEGYKKGDLVAYYRAVAPHMLHYLRDRPLVMTRFPDGIHGKSFFQQDAPPHIPAWFRRETVWSEESHKEIRYLVADDEASLLYVANLASIPIHVWSSRCATLHAPDWTILDLDPKAAPFTDVVTVARAVHDLCDEIGLPSYIKTSGKSGLHVLVPLGRQCTYDQGRELALLIARVVCDRLPDKATLTRVIADRGGRVYVDCFQNGHGRLLVAPLCVRPEPGAPVSTPLRWSEVTAKLDVRKFTIKTVPARLAKHGDPLAAVVDERPDLLAALTALHRIMAPV
jgi:bifunctional non-homologous end joining protein LigD